MGVGEASADERVTLTPEPGMAGQPDPKDWEKWRWHLTMNAQVVYLYLRWVSTSPSLGRGRSLRDFARGVGDTVHGWKWHSRGMLSVAVFRRAMLELERAGLIEADEGDFE